MRVKIDTVLIYTTHNDNFSICINNFQIDSEESSLIMAMYSPLNLQMF